MIEFFLTTLRLVRGVGSAWKRDPQFRSLTFLVLGTLVGGTIFYSLQEGWSVMWMPSTSASRRSPPWA